MTTKQQKIDKLAESARTWLAKIVETSSTAIPADSDIEIEMFAYRVETMVLITAASAKMLGYNLEYLIRHQQDLMNDLQQEIADLKAENSKLVSDAGWTAEFHRQQLDSHSDDGWK